jgi:murein DD-endopeptidase MepM/ murein hydrolase activator NlpD
VRYLGGVLLLASAFILAAGTAPGDCRTPALTVEISSASPKQGGLVAVTVKSDVPLASAAASSGGRESAMERDEKGRLFLGLVGVDFESAVGKRELDVAVEGLCGDRHAVHRALEVVAGKFPVQKLKVAPAYVEPPASELDRIREEKEKVGRVWGSGDPRRMWDGPFTLPVDAPARDNFGSRRVFNGKPRSSHEGADLAAPAGAPVTAPGPGRVALADELYFSGGTVILDHGAGLFTMYFHLSRIDVKAGDAVAAGKQIGAVGATGRATGPHLHWGARLNRARINPLGLLQLPAWALEASENTRPVSQNK